jgi:hypothetical protein
VFRVGEDNVEVEVLSDSTETEDESQNEENGVI